MTRLGNGGRPGSLRSTHVGSDLIAVRFHAALPAMIDAHNDSCSRSRGPDAAHAA